MKVTKADLAVNPAFHLWRAGNAWQRAIRRGLDPLGLTFVQFTVLGSTYYLAQEGAKVTQRQVARLAFLDENMTSQVVRLLEKKGLMVRKSHPEDRRAYCLALTEKGMQVTEEARAKSKELRDIVFGTLGDRQEIFIELLEMVSRKADEVADATCAD